MTLLILSNTLDHLSSIACCRFVFYSDTIISGTKFFVKNYPSVFTFCTYFETIVSTFVIIKRRMICLLPTGRFFRSDAFGKRNLFFLNKFFRKSPKIELTGKLLQKVYGKFTDRRVFCFDAISFLEYNNFTISYICSNSQHI